MLAARRLLVPAMVGALDSILPKEITDEVLGYYLRRPELESVRKITVFYPHNGWCVFRIVGRAEYFASITDGEISCRKLGFIHAVSQGIRHTAPMTLNRKNMRRFLNNKF